MDPEFENILKQLIDICDEGGVGKLDVRLTNKKTGGRYHLIFKVLEPDEDTGEEAVGS